MSVEELRLKDVVTIAAEDPVYAAAERMAAEAVGCLVVVDEGGRAVGMLTDRDLALRCVAHARDLEKARVEDVMSEPLVVAGTGESMRAIVSRMKARGVRRIPFCRDGRPVGLVSLDDLLQVLSRELSDLGGEARARFHQARRKARFERVRGEIEHRLEEVRDRLRYANWYARESFLQELDDIRDSVNSALHVEEGAEGGDEE